MSFVNDLFGVGRGGAANFASERSWFGGRFATSNAASGAIVTEQTALTYSAVWACVRLLAETIAQLPCNLCEKTEDGSVPAVDDTLYRLIYEQPNPYMTAFAYRETCMGHVLTWGNSYSYIERAGNGDVLALYPLRPDRITPIMSDNGTLLYRRSIPGRQPITYPADSILHIAGFGFDGIMGYSPVQMFREAIGLGMAEERFAAQFFGNGAKPSAVLSHPGTLGPEGQDNLRKSILDDTSGNNALGLLILEEGMTWTQAGLPLKDAQFLEGRQFQTTEIARIYGVPPHMIGDLTRATFSNIEHQAIQFVRYSIMPWTVRIEHEYDRKLLGPDRTRDYGFEFRLEELQRGDSAARAAYLKERFLMGTLTINEVRIAEGQLPVGPEGDHLFMQVQMTTVDSVVNGTNQATTENVPPQDNPPEPPAEEQPSDDNEPPQAWRAATVDRITAAHRGVFVDVFSRMLTKESKAATTASKRPERFTAWRDEFYSEHAMLFRSAIIPAVEAYASSLFAVDAGNTLADFPAEAVGTATAEIVAWHVGQSVSALDNYDVLAAVAVWPTGRANDAADKAMAVIRSAVECVV